MAPQTGLLGVITQLLAFSSVCYGYPSLANEFREREVDTAASEYDYIIVGGGQSGLVIANRLSEDPRKKVLVVEYGYFDNNPGQLEPNSAFMYNPANLYNLTSVPQPGIGGGSSYVLAAAVVGGGSTVNGMMLNRGAPEDYDNWAKLKNPGWSWRELLPYFRKSHTLHTPGPGLAEEFNITWDQRAYGTGPIQVSYAPYQWPGTKIQYQAMIEAGAVSQKEGALDAHGVFWIPAAMDPKTMQRSYSVNGYYDPAKSRKNLEILTGTRVNTVVFDHRKRTTGVTIQKRDTPDGEGVETVKAKREVILCAGWLHTPQILQRSGVGPASLLREADIDVVVDLPGVGSNFQDHAAAGATFTYTTDVTPNPGLMHTNATFQAWAQEQWETNRTGPMGQTVGNTAGLIPLPIIADDYKDIIRELKSQKAAEHLPSTYNKELIRGYEAQRSILLKSFASHEFPVLELPFNGAGQVSLVLHKPMSRGTVLLNATDIYAEPLVDYNTLINPFDARVIANNYRFARKWMSTPSAQELGPEEVAPGKDLTTDAQLTEVARTSTGSSTAHGCCTAGMQPRNQGGVVAPDLTVYGVKGLSVGDASVMPLTVAAHTCATVYAIAEKAADLIKARNRW
ncbi:hypothetical protein AJ80_09237 [Polytolypa hystricis UAMH7299]|uniref:Glucose-methanol-choline oxidoreductase N-terminal domain-containing protein n=1 Tax=Polytolypa hystricis (strain UAMH7299) TaxID=1447883 RepID=A0A2B7WU38_POLH7|nr:hypothetical protein AJ80_09237 [Polytolypa hystricis UAMH7299]